MQINKLTEAELSAHCKDTETPSSNSGTPDSGKKSTPRKKLCYRPKHKPSKARVRAQRMIRERNIKIKNKELLPTPLKQTEPKVTTVRSGTSKITDDNTDDTVIYTPPDDPSSTDDTIIYTPPQRPEKRNKRKSVAKFVIRTVGLKTHQDTEQVKEGHKTRNRSIKCYLCGECLTLTRKLNYHCKIDHEGLDCLECSKEFGSPLSLIKNTTTYIKYVNSAAVAATNISCSSPNETSMRRYMTTYDTYVLEKDAEAPLVEIVT